MMRSLLSIGAALCVLSLQSCNNIPAPDSPWDLARGSRATTLAQREVQVRSHLINTEDGYTGFEPYVDIQYGALDNLTLSASLGQGLRRSVYQRDDLRGLTSNRDPDPFAEEVASIGVNYGLGDNPQDGGPSVQLQSVFTDGSVAEFRPSFGWHADSFQIRGGANLADRLDERLFVEGAYWKHLGDFLGLIEVDAILGDVEGEDFDEIYIAPGVITQLRELVQFQVSAPVGLTTESADWQLLIGLVFRL